MTVQELIEKLEQIPNKGQEVRVKNGLLIVGEKILIDNDDDLR